jgi:hypothetical protein
VHLKLSSKREQSTELALAAAHVARPDVLLLVAGNFTLHVSADITIRRRFCHHPSRDFADREELRGTSAQAGT